MEEGDSHQEQPCLSLAEPFPHQQMMNVVIVGMDNTDPMGDAEQSDTGHVHQGNEQGSQSYQEPCPWMSALAAVQPQEDDDQPQCPATGVAHEDLFRQVEAQEGDEDAHGSDRQDGKGCIPFQIFHGPGYQQ